VNEERVASECERQRLKTIDACYQDHLDVKKRCTTRANQIQKTQLLGASTGGLLDDADLNEFTDAKDGLRDKKDEQNVQDAHYQTDAEDEDEYETPPLREADSWTIQQRLRASRRAENTVQEDEEEEEEEETVAAQNIRLLAPAPTHTPKAKKKLTSRSVITN
jgi:hypothetical protein